MREDRQRLDKWLWYARFAKTRSFAARLVSDGYVRVNGERVENAAKALAVGDVVTVAAAHTTAVVRVQELGRAAALDRDDGALVSAPDTR